MTVFKGKKRCGTRLAVPLTLADATGACADGSSNCDKCHCKEGDATGCGLGVGNSGDG